MRGVACIVLVACGSAPPAKNEPYRAPASKAQITYAETPKYRPDLAPPPPIDLAVVIPGYEETRPWPLSELPSVQPHWDPAMARDACTDRWKERHANDAEAKAYVAAWCRLRAQDRGAIDALGKLARTARGEIARPARLDVVNLAADWWDARRAIAWLDSMSLGSIDTLDLLMGTYVGLGMRDEARTVVSRLGEVDRKPRPRSACERLIATARVNDLGLIGALQVSGAGECEAVAARARCALHAGWIDVMATIDERKCASILDPADSGLKVGFLREYSLFYENPKVCALDIVGLLQVPGAEAVAVMALENAARSADCNPDAEIAKIAERLLSADGHSSAFDARLEKLRAKPGHCM